MRGSVGARGCNAPGHPALQAEGRYDSHEHVTFDFLGYTFKPRGAKRKDGTMFTTFSPAISRTAATSIRQQIRRMRFHLRSDLSFAEIARWINARAGAWAAYYGRFGPSQTAYVLFHIDRYLVRWARCLPPACGGSSARASAVRPGRSSSQQSS